MKPGDPSIPADIKALHDAYEAAERDAEALVFDLGEEGGLKRIEEGSWSVAECLNHLATGSHAYLLSMHEPACRARSRGRYRRRPATPGWVGGLFVSSLEPPTSRLD